jgi:hypothetical protein
MALTVSQVESFVGDLSELFSIRPPRISRRRRIRCRWKKKTLHLGRKITRSELAHELAHYIQRELAWPPEDFVRPGPLRLRLHGARFKAWERLVGNYVAQEFGEGEGVTL